MFEYHFDLDTTPRPQLLDLKTHCNANQGGRHFLTQQCFTDSAAGKCMNADGNLQVKACHTTVSGVSHTKNTPKGIRSAGLSIEMQNLVNLYSFSSNPVERNTILFGNGAGTETDTGGMHFNVTLV